MAISHLGLNASLPHGQLLRSPLTQLENGRAQLTQIIDTMGLMIDGDGTDAAHFVVVAARFGFSTNEVAKAAWEELNSLKFKITTNAQVSDVSAALTQAFSKFR